MPGTADLAGEGPQAAGTEGAFGLFERFPPLLPRQSRRATFSMLPGPPGRLPVVASLFGSRWKRTRSQVATRERGGGVAEPEPETREGLVSGTSWARRGRSPEMPMSNRPPHPSFPAGPTAVLALGLFAAAPVPSPGGELAAQVQVEVGASREVLSGGREDWEEYWIRATVRPAPGTYAYGGVRHTRRFGQDDQQYEAGGGVPVGDRWSVGIDGTWSPTHRVMPRWGAAARARRSLPGGWGVSLGGGRRVWDEVRVDHQEVEVDRSVGAFRGAYRIRLHQVDPGRSGVGHRLSGSWSYGAGSSVTLALGAGREALLLDADRIESATSRSISLSGLHWLDARTGLTYRLTAYRHGDAFTRTSVGVGVRRGL